jgi:hypothetical protein
MFPTKNNWTQHARSNTCDTNSLERVSGSSTTFPHKSVCRFSHPAYFWLFDDNGDLHQPDRQWPLTVRGHRYSAFFLVDYAGGLYNTKSQGPTSALSLQSSTVKTSLYQYNVTIVPLSICHVFASVRSRRCLAFGGNGTLYHIPMVQKLVMDFHSFDPIVVSCTHHHNT